MLVSYLPCQDHMRVNTPLCSRYENTEQMVLPTIVIFLGSVGMEENITIERIAKIRRHYVANEDKVRR